MMAPRKLDSEIPINSQKGSKADELQRQASNKQLNTLCNLETKTVRSGQGILNKALAYHALRAAA
jgi:hypothetical protein